MLGLSLPRAKLEAPSELTGRRRGTSERSQGRKTVGVGTLENE